MPAVVRTRAPGLTVFCCCATCCWRRRCGRIVRVKPTTARSDRIVTSALYLTIRPQRRRQQQVAQQQKTVNPGARVRTTAGMYATVVEVDGDDVVLEVAPGVEVRYLKRAIMEVVSSAEEAEEAEGSRTATRRLRRGRP